MQPELERLSFVPFGTPEVRLLRAAKKPGILFG